MTLATMIGSDLIVTVSDPWEFGTECGTSLLAKVLQVGPNHWEPQSQALLLQLEKPPTFRGMTCEYLIATARHEKANLGDLMSGAEIDCNLTGIPQERAISATLFDLSWWRGGIALLGTLRRI